MSIFGGIEKIKVKTGGKREDLPYIDQPGSFDAKVVKIKAGRKAKDPNYNQPYCVVTVEVENVIDGPYNKGERHQWFKYLNSRYNVRDVKAFAAAASGESPDNIDEKTMNRLMGYSDDPDKPIEALIVKAESRVNVVVSEQSNGKLDRDGKPYVNVYFNPVDEGGETVSW